MSTGATRRIYILYSSAMLHVFVALTKYDIPMCLPDSYYAKLFQA